jgi:phosphate transport system permease protein
LNETRVLTPGEPLPAARLVAVTHQSLVRRLWMDRLARQLVTLGGVVIIGSILAILFVIAYEVYPLFKKPTASPVGAPLPGIGAAPLVMGVDEYREVMVLVTAGGLEFLSAKDGKSIASVAPSGLDGARIVAASSLSRGPGALGTSDGRAIPVEVKFAVTHEGAKRTVTPDPILGDPIQIDPAKRPIRHLASASPKEGPITAAVIGSRELVLVTVKERKALIGPSVKEETRTVLALPGEGNITALALDGRGEDLFAGTAAGEIVRVDLRDRDTPKVGPAVKVTAPSGVLITAISFLIGDRTLAVGDASGGVSTWQVLQLRPGGERRLLRVNTFTSHAGGVVAIEPSRRDKGFLTADASGTVHINFGTTGETLLTATSGLADARALVFAPKGDAFLLANGSGRTVQWTVNNPHPEITLRTLFGKVWYEGYNAPEYVWQSTGGTDDFESKLSLTPLIYGTLKGTFYALLFAVPIALLSALYASQFMHPTLKGVVKPVVEIMAALPSVVLGFLAGLWLAPQVERIVPGLFLMLLVTPVLILAGVFGWRAVPIGVRKRVRPGTEVALLVPLVLLVAWVSFQLGGVVERTMLSGDYRGWLLSALGLGYDQRNSLVVGLAMGFAVIPIIFTIAEDSLSNVPQHLSAGSLALGATPWQTALRVVLPTASPGIFSAIMIGFGRAVGETMIVLMATGNTPVMDWSIFNGFRALSANIAVELPEAPEGGTLFRVLFLAALLLFILTFVVNTVAELVRLRLRRKYRYL